MHTTTPHPGRFDMHEIEPAGPGYLYGAEAGSDEAVAIYETLKSRFERSAARGGELTLEWKERNCRTIQYFHTSAVITLVDIHDPEGRSCFHMGEEVQFSKDRDCTREWAKYIRDNVDDAVGIAYNSTQSTANLGQTSFILWEDRMLAAGVDLVPTTQIGMATPEGTRKMMKALKPDRVLMV